MNWVVVTGGARGLGAEICQHLAKLGYSLVIHYNTSRNDADKLKAKCESLGANVHTVQGDFNTKASTEKVLDEILSLNVPIRFLVNNVGNYLIQSLLDTELDDWYELFQVNVHAPFILSKGLSDVIVKQKGSIVNIGVTGLETGKADTYSAAYTITKQALFCMTKSLAKELASQGVRVNMISPGYLSNAVDLPKDLNKLPMQRAVSLSEIAEMVEYLFKESGKSITGQNIEIAGGVRI